MSQLEISIVKLQDELKEAYNNISSLLKERDALKKAYSMQIDLVRALESRIDKLEHQNKPVNSLEPSGNRDVQSWMDHRNEMWNNKSFQDHLTAISKQLKP